MSDLFVVSIMNISVTKQLGKRGREALMLSWMWTAHLAALTEVFKAFLLYQCKGDVCADHTDDVWRSKVIQLQHTQLQTK